MFISFNSQTYSSLLIFIIIYYIIIIEIDKEDFHKWAVSSVGRAHDF